MEEGAWWKGGGREVEGAQVVAQLRYQFRFAATLGKNRREPNPRKGVVAVAVQVVQVARAVAVEQVRARVRRCCQARGCVRT